MTLNPSEVAKIEKLVDGGHLTEVVIEQDGEHIVIGGADLASISVDPVAVLAPVAGSVALGDTVIGRVVGQGDEIARLSVLDVETSVTAPQSGRVAAILAQDGALIGYGADIILIEPEKTA